MDPRVTEKSDVVYSEAGRVPEYVCVEYPGHVTSVDDMLETLGGLDMISHVYSDVNRRLELRFRPSDSYCKPACATRASATGLLVRVTRRVKKKKLQKAPCATASSSVVQPTEATKSSSSAAAQPCHSEEFRSTLLGVVRTSYTFNTLCDFQYLPLVPLQDADLPSGHEGDHARPSPVSRISKDGTSTHRPTGAASVSKSTSTVSGAEMKTSNSVTTSEIQEAETAPPESLSDAEFSSAERPSAELPSTELPSTELPSTELPSTELPSPELPSPELPSPELPSPELSSTELPSAELSSTELPSAERPSAELPSAELPSAELPSAELPSAELPSAELPSAELPSAELSPENQSSSAERSSSGLLSPAKQSSSAELPSLLSAEGESVNDSKGLYSNSHHQPASQCSSRGSEEKKSERGFAHSYECFVPQELVSSDWLREEPQFLFLPPPAFTRMDTPQAYFFRGEESESTTRPQTASSSAACKSVSTSSASATAVLETEVCVSSSVRPCPSVTAAPDSVNAADVDAEPAIHVKGTSVRPTPNVIYRTRQRRTLFAILCDFDSITPSEPHPEALKQLNLKFLQRSMSPVYDRLKQLFEERPVWSRAGIKSALGYSSDNLKYLLPTLGYYFIAGPWRNLWIKFGYNPREKPESFVYQTFNYRLKQSGLIKSYIDAKRNYSSYLLPYKSNAMSRKKVSVIQSNLLSSSSFSSKSITCNNGNKNSNLSKKQISEVTLPSPPCGDGSKDSATVNDNGLVIAAEEEEEAEKDDGDEIDYSLLDPDCEDNTFGDLNCGENTVEEEGESIVSDSERGGSSTAEECLREENYIYRPGCIPPYRQMFYQYCDVLVPEIQQVLERCVLETNERLCCDPRYGWLSRRAEEECRSIMGRVVEAAVRKRTAHEREQRLKATPAAASTVPAAPADTAS